METAVREYDKKGPERRLLAWTAGKKYSYSHFIENICILCMFISPCLLSP